MSEVKKSELIKQILDNLQIKITRRLDYNSANKIIKNVIQELTLKHDCLKLEPFELFLKIL